MDTNQEKIVCISQENTSRIKDLISMADVIDGVLNGRRETDIKENCEICSLKDDILTQNRLLIELGEKMKKILDTLE